MMTLYTSKRFPTFLLEKNKDNIRIELLYPTITDFNKFTANRI